LTLLAENPKTLHVLITLFAESQFLTDLFLNRPELIDTLIRVDLTHVTKNREQMLGEMQSALSQCDDTESKLNALRRYKNEEFIRIGLHDLGGAIDLLETLHQLSDLADASVQAVLDVTLAELNKNYGAVPHGHFTVIGGGKMGGRELDYNSDLDLIFVVESAAEPAAWAESARRRAESVIHLITAITQEGSLYSVDLRLRPAGGEGELLQSVDGLLEYFSDEARTWERMALLKARPVAGNLEFGRRVVGRLEERILGGARRESLAADVREMKEKLEQSISGRLGDGIPLKLGPGGVMEIHFIIEYLQLVHGVAGIADRNTLKMLSDLHLRGLISDNDYPMLYASYLLFRGLDHAMRLLYDKPGDFLPLTPVVLSRLAREVSLSLSSSQRADAHSLVELVRETCASVRECYQRIVV
jgi:glutamate-ammonia-ligase adenylyltransferase